METSKENAIKEALRILNAPAKTRKDGIVYTGSPFSMNCCDLGKKGVSARYDKNGVSVHCIECDMMLAINDDEACLAKLKEYLGLKGISSSDT